MAMNIDRDPSDKKVSSLEGDGLPTLSRETAASGRRSRDRQKDRVLKRRSPAAKGLIVDLVILVLVAAIGVGIWFGYGAVKSLYSPEWEIREVVFSVEIRNVDYDRADQLLPTLSDHDLWYSSSVEGDRLGTVSDVRAVPSVTEDGRETMTLYLTVETEARYRKGEGYYVGTTRILAGETGTFRAEGLAAEGMVVSLEDLTEVTA